MNKPDPNDDLHPREAEEPKKPYQQILSEEMGEGLKALERPAWGLLLSSLSAGLDLGFSVLLMGAAITHLSDTETIGARLLIAAMYSLGFMFVVIGRSELFTEHTTLAVLPVLHGEAPLWRLIRLWVLVYVGNELGAGLFAWAASRIGPGIGVVEPRALTLIATRLLDKTSSMIFFSGVLAGWLMGLLSWLVAAARDTISQIVIVLVVTGTIGFLGLHHAVLGTVEVLGGVFSGATGWEEVFPFLCFATLGNAAGGIVFVAVLKYSHAVRGQAPRPAKGGDHEP